MRLGVLRLCAAASLAAAICLAPAAPARAQEVTARPAAVTLALEGTPSFFVTYQRSMTGFPVPCSVQGSFAIPGGAVFGTIDRTVTLAPAGAGRYSVQEQVTVPSPVMDEVRGHGIAQLRYNRVFAFYCGTPRASFVSAPSVAMSFVSAPVEAQPNPALVASVADTVVPVQWRIGAAGGAVRVDSAQGRFVDSRGRVYGAAVAIPMTGSGPGPVQISERLLVPADVVRSALAAQADPGLRFERTFTVNGMQMQGSLNLLPASALQAVRPQPGQASVTPQTANGLSVRWEGVLLPGIVGATLTLTSSDGLFRTPDGRVLRSTGTALSQSVVLPAATAPTGSLASGPVLASEQLIIPHDVIDAVLSAGFTSFVYERTFHVGGDAATGQMRLDLAGRVASTFGLDRIDVRFLDGTRSKTVPPGEEVLATADITFRGSGRLRGSWDVAGPTSTPGAATFTRRELIDETLSFGHRTVIRSPAFVSREPGLYIVRLTVTEPDLGDAGQVQLSYVVRASVEPAAVVLGQPPPQAPAAAGTPFAWTAVAGAQSYLLEIFDAPSAEGREPASGMVLPAGRNAAKLSAAAARNLAPGRSYWWRVVALGPEGVTLAQSPLRELVTPKE
jgi:hypothetical protein